MKKIVLALIALSLLIAVPVFAEEEILKTASVYEV